MWTRRRLVGVLGAGFCVPAAAQFRVEISGIGATRIPVAIGAFSGEPGAPVSLSEVVRADLERSGSFATSKPPMALDERTPLPQEPLRLLGADALLVGSVSRVGGGKFDVRYRLWDVIRNETLFARAQTADDFDLRQISHRIADEVYEALTGERGAFNTRIAYVTRQGRTHSLHVADADGENAQVAVRSIEAIISPAWSPDGRDLAYVSFETQKAAVWIQTLATGTRTLIANFRGSNSAPAWTPDGQQLALTLSRDSTAQLYLLPRAGGTPRRLTTSLAIDTEPVFGPDGRTVYFVSDRGGGPQVYRIPIDGGDAERLTFGGSYNISPAISPDGRTLAYISRQGGAFRLSTLDLSRGTISTLTDTAHDESPSFAPNGRLILYATRVQGRGALMTTTLDGKVRTRLADVGADAREPAWGPFAR